MEYSASITPLNTNLVLPLRLGFGMSTGNNYHPFLSKKKKKDKNKKTLIILSHSGVMLNF